MFTKLFIRFIRLLYLLWCILFMLHSIIYGDNCNSLTINVAGNSGFISSKSYLNAVFIINAYGYILVDMLNFMLLIIM